MRAEALSTPNKSPILSLAYSSRLKMLAIGQMGNSVKIPSLSLWRSSNRKVASATDTDAYGNIWAICFDFRDKYLIFSNNSKLFCLDIESKQKRELKIDNGQIRTLISSKTSPRVIVSGKHVEVLDIDTGKSIWKSKGYEAGTLTKDLQIQGLPPEWTRVGDKLSFVNEPATIAMFSNGEAMLIGGHNKGNIEQVEVGTDRVVKTISPAPLQAYMMSLGCNETVLAVSSKIPYANFVWELDSGKRMAPEIFNERFGGYSSLCLHSTERLMASGSLVGFVSVQDLDSGGFAFSERLHSGRVSQVLFTDKATIYSGGDDGEVRIVDVIG